MFTTGRSKALIVSAALAGVSALLLAGCSGPSDSGSNSGKVQLTFHSWLPTQDQWKDLIAAFEKENPDITITFDREEDYDHYKTNLDNEILANKVPDIYGIQVGASFDDYSQYAKNVDDYASSWIGDLNASTLKQTTNSKGKVKAVPVLLAGMEYYLYNKTLMDKAGITAPTDYASLVAAAEKARAAGFSPFAMGAADAWHDADFFTWLSTQYGDGQDIYKAAAGTGKWDSKNLVAAATAWQKLFKDGVFEDAATTVTTYPSARDDYFLAGKSVFFPTGSWHVGAALSTSPEVPGSAVAKDEIGMAVFPTVGPKDAGVTSGVDFALAISDSSSDAKQKAAEKFVRFMADGKGQQLWVDTLQGFPVAKNVSVQIGDKETALAKQSVDLVTKSLQASTNARKPVSPTNSSLENDLGVVLQKIAGGSDPAQELATLKK
jgi:raffinose/stachyose/melibiose transport system substrate-binding protein